MIQVEQLSVRRDERVILDELTFTVPDGCIAGLLGRNGAGKTTLLHVLGFLSKPDQGGFSLAPSFSPKGVPDTRQRGRVGAVFEKNFLYNHLTAYENLLFYSQLYGVKNPKQKVESWLQKAQLSGVGDQQVHTFSKGMKQRLSIARALLHDPDVLLMDEPFDGLDEQSVRWIRHLMSGKKANGASLLLVSHQVSDLLACCDRILVLERGRLLLDAAVEQVDQDAFGGAYGRLLEGASRDEFLESVMVHS